jgi:hypothetical protein
MRYSFDSAKRSANLKKHGFDLVDAKQVIESENTVTFEDHRYAYDEPRFVTFGVLREQVIVIVTTETEDHIRIISLRKADRHEQKIYFDNL